jgi:hypothetical protein
LSAPVACHFSAQFNLRSCETYDFCKISIDIDFARDFVCESPLRNRRGIWR